MARVRFEISMSLDGFVAGPNQSEEHPLGEGAMALHEWVFGLEAWRAMARTAARSTRRAGAIEAPGVTHLTYRVVR